MKYKMYKYEVLKEPESTESEHNRNPFKIDSDINKVEKFISNRVSNVILIVLVLIIYCSLFAYTFYNERTISNCLRCDIVNVINKSSKIVK